MTEVRKLALPLLAGVVLATSAPPFDVFPALWLGMAALAWLLDEDPACPPFASRARVALTGARRGLAFGIGANLVALRFVPGVVARFTPLPWVVGALGLLLLAAFEASRWALAAVACETLARASVPRPLAFAAGVYAGTFLPTMMPWTVAGGVSPWPSMVQLADLVGERGVAAIMALAAGLLAWGVRAALRRETRTRGALAVAAAGLVVAAQGLYGKHRIASVERERDAAPHVSVGLVQPSVGASTRWDEARAPAILDELLALTRRAESQGAELVVWHEAAYPYRLPHGARTIADARRAIVRDGVRGPVLTGLLLATPDDDSSFNSVAVVSPDGSISAFLRQAPPALVRGDGPAGRSGPAAAPPVRARARPHPGRPRGGADGRPRTRGGARLLRGHASGGRARGDDGRAEPARQRDERRVVRGQLGERASPSRRRRCGPSRRDATWCAP